MGSVPRLTWLRSSNRDDDSEAAGTRRQRKLSDNSCGTPVSPLEVVEHEQHGLIGLAQRVENAVGHLRELLRGLYRNVKARGSPTLELNDRRQPVSKWTEADDHVSIAAGNQHQCAEFRSKRGELHGEPCLALPGLALDH